MTAHGQNVDVTARKLSAYLRRRTAVEGVPMRLPIRFFRTALNDGIVNLLGIFVDVDRCELVCDEQEPVPGFFSEWKVEFDC